MGISLKLIYYDDEMERREVEVTTSRFAIGRHEDNDCVVDDSNLSRRHALIEDYDGVYFLSDCGSQNGTTLNGRSVSGPAQINNGDIIKLGGSFELRVELVKEASTQDYKSISNANASSHAAAKKTSSTNQKVSSATSGLSVMAIQILIGVIAVSLILVVGAIVIIAVNNIGVGKENVNNNVNTNEEIIVETSSPSPSETTGPVPSNTNETNVINTPQNPQVVKIEDAAKKAIKQMSTDELPYGFPDVKILTAINAKAESYRGSPQLRETLRQLQSKSQAIASQVKSEGLPPALVVFTALALTNGGANGDPSAKATTILSDLSWLYRTFGTGTSDSSLIVIAAFTYGTGNKKTHPIHNELRKIPEAMSDRNVWFMHDKGLIKDEAYNLVVNTIALGAIAQNPKQFGIDAQELTF